MAQRGTARVEEVAAGATQAQEGLQKRCPKKKSRKRGSPTCSLTSCEPGGPVEAPCYDARLSLNSRIGGGSSPHLLPSMLSLGSNLSSEVSAGGCLVRGFGIGLRSEVDDA